MKLWRKFILDYPVISWVLILAFLLQLLMQLHFHLHHDEQVANLDHDHVVDIHLLVEDHPVDHPAHDNAHEITSTPDVIGIKNLNNDFPFVLFTFLVLITTVFLAIINRWWSYDKIKYINNQYFGLAPPSRAPPAY